MGRNGNNQRWMEFVPKCAALRRSFSSSAELLDLIEELIGIPSGIRAGENFLEEYLRMAVSDKLISQDESDEVLANWRSCLDVPECVASSRHQDYRSLPANQRPLGR